MKKIIKNFGGSKKVCIFAPFKTKNSILILGCVVFFIATNSAHCAVSIGYQPLADCCTSKVSDCSWSNIGEGSLSFFEYFNFSSQMTKNKKNYNGAKHSNACVTSDYESVTQLKSPCLRADFQIGRQSRNFTAHLMAFEGQVGLMGLVGRVELVGLEGRGDYRSCLKFEKSYSILNNISHE
jgi:hypothetical protein